MSSARISRSSAGGIGPQTTKPEGAFTFVELIVVVAVFVAVFALVALPSLARSKSRSPAVGCLSNLRQLMIGWQMYTDENRGALMVNKPIGSTGGGWCSQSEGWGNILANTNVASVVSGLMGKYVSSNVTVYRCPADVVPSANGIRLRSYSMNSQIGAIGNFAAPLRLYAKESDIVCPTPATLFVLADEHPGSMDDGFLQVSYTPTYPNVPASYHEGGCGFSFADGHCELRKWRTSTLLIPVTYNVTVQSVATSATDSDWIWFSSRTGCAP